MLAVVETFIRFFVGVTFAASFFFKARDVASFQKAITGFGLLPSGLVAPAAWIFLAGELAAALLLLWLPGPSWMLTAGFALALVLLAVFTSALMTVLHRGLDVSCNCFGKTARTASRHDVWRNLGVMACCGLGLGLAVAGWPEASLRAGEQVLVAAVAIVAVALWTSLADLAELFQNP